MSKRAVHLTSDGKSPFCNTRGENHALTTLFANVTCTACPHHDKSYKINPHFACDLAEWGSPEALAAIRALDPMHMIAQANEKIEHYQSNLKRAQTMRRNLLDALNKARDEKEQEEIEELLRQYPNARRST